MLFNKTRVVHDAVREPKRFLKVSEVAAVLGVDCMTLYRAIRDGEFPAIKIRGRYVIPARVLNEMEEAALTDGTVVDAADWLAITSAGRSAAASRV